MTENELKALPALSIPYSDLKIVRDEDAELKIFDTIREKYVMLTPEELVRQNFIGWLMNYKGYPKSHIANEVGITLNGTKKRCDTVIYGRDASPLILIEYKAPDVEITQQTFDQIVRYNRVLKAKYLIVSNGCRHYCCVMDYNTNSFNYIRLIPDYNEAVGMPSVN